uniref:Uncharacterized protein n=1 Tax=Picea sitchensis TaxID=3332 RepID=A9NWC4_PICSI|nr:unknown [Picea sitchensis]
MELKERILTVSDEYIRLTQLISPILTVPFDLDSNQESIYTISGKLQAKRKLHSDLGRESKKLFEEYKSHSGSFGKRLSLRLQGNGGKRSNLIESSKLRWEEARNEEARAQELVAQLESQLAEVEESREGPLDKSVIRKKAIAALREIMKEVSRKDSEHDFHFELLPDYED